MDDIVYELCNYLEDKLGLFVHVGAIKSFDVKLIFSDDRINQNYIMEIWIPRKMLKREKFLSIFCYARYRLECLVGWKGIYNE